MSKPNPIPETFPKARALAALLDEHDRDVAEAQRLRERRESLLKEADAIARRPSFDIDKAGALVANARSTADVIVFRVEAVEDRMAERTLAGKGLLGAVGEVHDAAFATRTQIWEEIRGSAMVYAGEGLADQVANLVFNNGECGLRLLHVEANVRGFQSFPGDARSLLSYVDELEKIRALWEEMHPTRPAPTVDQPQDFPAVASK